MDTGEQPGIAGEAFDSRHVATRADEWVERLQALRNEMERWIGSSGIPNLEIVERQPATMDEELMRRHGLEPRRVSVFDVAQHGRPVMRVLPRGLWVIGANGRVDLVTRSAAPILVDVSEPLSGGTNWRIYGPLDDSPVPFTRDVFLDLIRKGLH